MEQARRDAIIAGTKRYLSAFTCWNGHENPERFACSAACCECSRLRQETARERLGFDIVRPPHFVAQLNREAASEPAQKRSAYLDRLLREKVA
jgi:hypothetical protein